MFVHLHVHSEYSILDGASKISKLVDKAMKDSMPAVALTDHGSMFGVKEFFDYVSKKNAPINDKVNGLQKQLEQAKEAGEDVAELEREQAAEQAKRFKPIIGCEVYVASGSRHDKKGKEDASGDHLILLAKNKTGYHNLVKLVSIGYLEGYYYKPRIDKEVLKKYHEGLIVSSACLGGEIPQYILKNDMENAEKSILWFKDLFGDDYYLELQRHKTTDSTAQQDVYPQQVMVNEKLLELAAKLNVKVVATNDVHFVNEDEAQAHDRLLCISTAADVNDPKRMRYTRQEWFKTASEMQHIFADLPEALANTLEIANKVEFYDINSKALMPKFPLPEGFDNDGDYLRHITYHGVEKGNVPGAYGRYGENLSTEVKERIDFELDTMINMGFPGYFLIVQDFIAAARDMGVWVGPGRGSAAGSVVAYCLRITDIDPLKYDLLFERFLNPDRISMPDIDIDFDDDGRGKVLQYVTDKYGKEKVAHIVTFGTMAAKSAIKDVARVQQLPLAESNRLAGLIDQLPRDVSVSIKNAIEKVPDMKAASESNDSILRDTLKFAQILEGTVRNTGVHACGIIIGSDDLANFVPLSTAEDKETKEKMTVTQYEGTKVEDVGLIKMDFLGLKTLSILKEAVTNVKQNRGIDIDIDQIPIDDKITYDLYSRGDTVGTFQFESDGMRKYLRELQPTQFEDLIAMNALYRPGPMQYIPDFIDRKHGRKKIKYDILVMEQYLKDTYGITVYQEQVMLLSRLLGNFTRGQSDELRKAMGKKIREKLDALKPKFVEGCKQNGYDEKVVNDIWKDWEAFASYAFNKSHATCYSWVSYQTAYLKANYPAEYMAGLLSCNLNNIDEISKFMDESRRMGIEVLGPDVNESMFSFSVNKAGNIRFGLAGVKGVGRNAVEDLVQERQKNGPFTSVFNFVERVNLQTLNKKTMESLAGSGALDSFGIPRVAYFAPGKDDVPFYETILRYGVLLQQSQGNAQQSLFGGDTGINVVQTPEPPRTDDAVGGIQLLMKEKQLIGIYLSAHPLDEYKLVIEKFTNTGLEELKNPSDISRKEVIVAGMVTRVQHLTTKTGKPYGRFTLEDYDGGYELTLFAKDYVEFSRFFVQGESLLVRGNIQERFTYGNNNDDKPKELEFKIKRVDLLSEVSQTGIKNINVVLPLSTITPGFVDNFVDNIQANPGNVKLTVTVCDEEVRSDAFSRQFKVNVQKELLDYFEVQNLTFTIS
ncbi:MAG: DNA polymerase III subunit alpha [Prevotellaceae bacterium]|jgi:DNA polymerase-3 subunit alpha|nr:DNA polymerase III subunit alpha [Prevotellaceae bacterium]